MNSTYKMSIKKYALVAISLLIPSLSSCMPVDYSGELVNGYTLYRTSGISIGIDSPNEGILFIDNITRINIENDLIFGKISELEPELQRFVRDQQNPGYFIVDTETDDFVLALSQKEWLERLAENDISEEPVLLRPSSFRDEPALVTMLKAILRISS